MLKVIKVRFGSCGKSFTYGAIDNLHIGDKVVVPFAQSKVVGIVETEPFVLDEKVVGNVQQVLRVATNEDITKAKDYENQKKEIGETATKLVKKYNLAMKIVDIDNSEYGKIVIRFVCEERVDFRELVKDLATTLHSRIELVQIGSRDNAKNIGGVGPCGQELCCTRYLNDFDKVSIKMAKTQNLSLNPAKISGVCGRLMCCLSFENNVYAEINENMPKIGSTVTTSSGEGTVVYNDLLKQKVNVKFVKDNDISVVSFDVSDIKFNKSVKNDDQK